MIFNNGDKSGWKFRTRVFIMILSLVLLLLFSVYIFIQLFLNRYIEDEMITQLNEATQNLSFEEYKPPPKDDRRTPSDDFKPDFKRGNLGTQTEAFIINSDFEITSDIRVFSESSSSPDSIANYFRKQKADISSLTAQYIKADNRQYYVSSKLHPDNSGSYIVFFVDVTGIDNFSNMINMVMLFTILIAVIISFLVAFFISKTVTRPVKELSSFAKQIGTGDFKVRKFKFVDTEFNELAKAMNYTADKLQKYDSDQKSFFQNASHELRTPLMSIKGYAEGIYYGIMAPKKSSQVIIFESDRLAELVEDLLYVSRIDNLTGELQYHEMDIRETLSSCGENLKSLADKKKLKIKYEFDDEGVIFNYDEKYMYRAFYNVISNAIRYANKQIIIRCSKNSGLIRIEISDDGAGISPELLPRIFERFSKGEKGGYGIGLSIVKSIVEIHNGEIRINQDNLTTFIIEFKTEN